MLSKLSFKYNKKMEGFVKELVDNELLIKEWAEFSTAFEHAEQPLKAIVYTGEASHPAGENIFRALNECKPDDLKVVILGQDPFHDGSATGLAFDNRVTQKKISPSLKAILKEIQADSAVRYFNEDQFAASHLEHLPQQGVLLLNTALTVEHGKAGSHTKLWESFTTQLIEDVQKKDNIVWILWGNHAKAFKKLITNTSHYIIEGGHPSPLNTSVPFAGGKYFSECNSFLRTIAKAVIQW